MERKAPGITVAQVIGSFKGGGAERLAYNLALGLNRRGVRAIPVALRDGESPDPSMNGDMTIVSLAPAGRGLRARIGAARRFRRLLRELAVDVVHVHGSRSISFCSLATVGMRRRPRMCFTWHDSQTVAGGAGAARALLVWSMRRCSRAYGSSKTVAEKLRAACAGRPVVVVFPNGVPESEAGAGRAGEAPVILWTARFTPPKDPQALVRAAARLKAEGLRFRVVMAGSAPGNLRWFFDETLELARTLGVDDVISTPGWVDDGAALLREASIGVQTSHTEGLSMSVLEQMMAGLAVVATDVGDTGVAVVDGETGLLVPAQDDDALTDALRRLLTDGELRARLGRTARERALERFSVDAMARFAEAEYRAMVEAA